MANDKTQRELKYDEATIQAFVRKFWAVIEEGQATGVPLPFMEAACRDFLSSVEAVRLAPNLLDQWQRRGVQAVMLKGKA